MLSFTLEIAFCFQLWLTFFNVAKLPWPNKADFVITATNFLQDGAAVTNLIILSNGWVLGMMRNTSI